MTNETIKPRVRFAPSPTGFLHVGSARAALFNWLYARHTGGKYLLRIEDTDLERSTEEATRQIIDSLEWLGLTPDEPIEYQARRAHIHAAYLDRLLAAGRAYRCYCPKERLEQLRDEAARAGTIFAYRREMYPEDEAERAKAAGAPGVIRFRAPLEGSVAFDDMVYGHIEVDVSTIGDFVIARGDGSPLYNFTNVVDDIDMGITHICRGEDHVPNTPKQVLIYQALGATPPRFAHLPLILGTDKKKLSKRHGATGVMQFEEMGVLPRALVNFLALLGWAPDAAEFDEVMPIEDLVAKFSLDRVNKSPGVFDYDKLLWMNGMYIRQTPREQLRIEVRERLCRRFGESSVAQQAAAAAARGEAGWLGHVIDLGIERSRTLNEFGDILDFFFAAPASYDEKGARKQLGTPEQVAALRETGEEIRRAFDAAPPGWAAVPIPEGEGHGPGSRLEWLEKHLREWGEARGLKFGGVAQPVRLALTGKTASPGLFDIIYLLGRDETLRRIGAAIRHFTPANN